MIGFNYDMKHLLKNSYQTSTLYS